MSQPTENELYQRRDQVMRELFWQPDTLALEDPMNPNFVVARNHRDAAQGYSIPYPWYPQHLREYYNKNNMQVDANKYWSPNMMALAGQKLQERMYDQIFPQKKYKPLTNPRWNPPPPPRPNDPDLLPLFE